MLNLTGGEEATRARVLSKAKMQIIVVGHGETMFVGVFGIFTFLEVAEAIEKCGSVPESRRLAE